MAKDGYLWVFIPLLATVVAGAMGFWWLAAVLLSLTAFMAYFFRDPKRDVPAGQGIIISPADGRVTRVERASQVESHTPTVVSIFLSPLDVHINRAPIAGTIIDVTYTKGRFIAATSDKASLVNEQNALTIKGEEITVVCKQIAGVLARRIVCWKRAGDEVQLGERFGLIKFSSRTDLILPAEVRVLVKPGDRVRGGVTIIGRLENGK